MLVVFTVEQVFVDPVSPLLIKRPAPVRKRLITGVPCHLFGGAQRAQVPDVHLGIGTIVFHIHGIMLAAFHHAIMIRVPSARYPAERQCFSDIGQQSVKRVVIAGELPVAVYFHEAAHLAVRGCVRDIPGTLDRQ